MKNRKLIRQLMKNTNMDKALAVFMAWIVVASIILVVVEPHINNFGTAIWYCFQLVTTVGFGDIPAVTAIGRIVSIVVGLYGLFILALLTALIVDFYQEKMHIRRRESVAEFMDKLERLPELSHEELVDLSERVKKFK